MSLLALPELKFDLPDWQDQDFERVKASERKVKALVNRVGTNSDKFKTTLTRLFTAVCRKNERSAKNLLKTSLDVRAFTFLMATSEDVARRIELDDEFFEVFKQIRSPMSRVSLTQLIRAFFTHFDLYIPSESLKSWAVYIRNELEQYEHRSRGSGQLSTYVEHRDLIFSSYGPSRIVRQSQEEHVDFDVVLGKYNLKGFADARYIQLCRYQYYLTTLRSIEVGEEHEILAEIVKPQVVNSPYIANKQLGHEILEILIDRSRADEISPSWQAAVLEIAGDPRVPNTSAKYQQWWSLLGDERIAKVRGWLSRFDLKLFLQVLEQSAVEGRNSEMSRMFKDRKVFMEGLLNQGLVINSRLFLSKQAEFYLKKSYRKAELPEYATVDSRDTSMIYLNLGGVAHMIEGSHSFRIKLMDKLPESLGLTTYSINRFKDDDLRSSPKWHYSRQFGEGSGYTEFAHSQKLSWQHKAIEFLKGQNLKFEIGKLIPRDQYRLYKEKYGVN